MKKLMSVLTLAAVATMGLSALSTSFADTIGYVDFNKLFAGYEKAQKLQREAKVKDADLQKLKADLVKQLEDGKVTFKDNPVKLQEMEKQLSEQFQAKFRESQDWLSTQEKQLQTSLEAVIKQVAATKSVDVILNSQAVFEGGMDLTNDVLTKLNATK